MYRKDNENYIPLKDLLIFIDDFNVIKKVIKEKNIEEFLKKLDKDEGDNGDFIQFIDTFNEQKISVKHIKDLNDNEFQILGVKTIGWRKTIQTAAKQYK